MINEGERIRSQIEALGEDRPNVDVFIADGGSTDGSLDVRWLSETVVSGLLVKQDVGTLSAQLRMAMAHTLRAGYSGVITMDGNAKDGVEGITRIAAALDSGAGFVQGSRYAPGGEAINTPVLRDFAIRVIHAPATSLGARKRFTDSTNGFRGYSRELLLDPRVAVFRDIFDTYELLAYLPIRAGRLGYATCEVPVRRSYPATGSTPSKIHGPGAYFDLLRILADAIRGRFSPTDQEQRWAARRQDIGIVGQ